MAQAAADSGAGDGTDDGMDAGAPGGDGGGSDDSGQVLVTIAKDPSGGYLVYSGDEPDGGDAGDGGEGQSEDDIAAAAGGGGAGDAGGDGGGGAGAAEGAQGQHADSIGEALNLALDILNEAESSEGGEGSSEDQFAAGFTGAPSPAPAAGRPMRQRY